MDSQNIVSYLSKFDMVVSDLAREESLADILYVRTNGSKEVHSFLEALFVELISSIFNVGVWLSVIYKKGTIQTSFLHVLNEKCKGYGRHEAMLSGWVLSNSFYRHGYIEPLDQLLFTGASHRCPLVIDRTGALIFYEGKVRNKLPLLIGDVAEAFSAGGDVDQLLEQYRKNFIKRCETHDWSIKDLQEEDYEWLSNSIDSVVEEMFKSDLEKRSLECTRIAVTEVLGRVRTKKDSQPTPEDLNRISLGLIKSLVWNRLLDLQLPDDKTLGWNKIFYVPEALTRSGDASGLILAIDVDDNRELDVIDVLTVVCNRVFAPLYFRSYLDDTMKAQIQSAIGSIMSRNGSHNIGSHVLAALSHNVGTMPDDRVLYQYIQYRMDYIATVTTDMPKWRHPMQFVGDIMKHFLTQRHLLDYIAGSEGLKAWQFQNPNANNSHCLKFHVRRMETRLVDVNGAEVHKRVLVHDFLKYPESGPIDLTYDVPLAIPGGIVGQHALFTIFENIVRNAAKHDWAVQHPLSEKNDDQSDDNLDVYIEFEDKPESGVVEFIIYTSKSDATTEVETPGEKLWQRQNERINTPLINDQGELRRENWGLAEMKISAGYLQSREMTEIGGLDATDEKVLKDRERFGSIIEVVPVDKDGTDEDKLQLKGRLGYKFKVPKPKTFLLLVESEKVVPEGEQAVKLMAAGIYVRARSKIKPTDDDMSAEFVIMSSFDKECLQWRLPFRIITTNPGSNLDIVKDQLASWSNSLTDDAKFDSVDAIVQALCCGALTPEMLAKRVAVCWTDYMIGRRLDLSGKLNLIVAPTLNKVGDDEDLKSRLLRVGSEGNVQGSGKSLINPASAVTYVFEEGFDRAVGSFVKLYKLDVLDGGPEEEEKKSTYAALKAMRDMRPRRIGSEIRKSDAGYETLVPLQLKAWMAALKCSGDVLCYLETRCASGDDAELSDVIRQIAELKKSMPTKYSDDPRWRDLVRRSNRISSRRRLAARDAKHFFSHFVDYLIEVCKQAKGYLGKYAENISSLPAGYEIKSDGGTVTGKAEYLKSEGAQASDWEFGRLHVYTKCVDCKQQPVVLYVRHLNQNDGVNRSDGDDAPPPFVESPFAAFAGAVHYAESLSGTQSYLNQLMRLSVEKSIIQAKLVENALMRLLILDERMSRFVREHADSMLATFARMSVTIADERSVGIEGEMDASDSKGKNSEEDSECALRYTTQGLLDINPAHVRALRDLVMLSKDRDSFEDGFKQAETGMDLYRSKFDILVIHQGIIDKWFPAVAHDPKKMPLLLYGLRRVFPYVVITTGRGTPANVPEMARVLPFPTVATTMFKKYPEKLVLVDAIMNLLPIRKR